MLEEPTADLEPSTIRKRAAMGLVAVFATHFSSTFLIRGLVVASPRIAADLDGMDLYAWAISLPALASAFVTLTFSKLSDTYGRRMMLAISMGLFIVGAILAATSQTFEFNIVARVILGMGQGALAPLCFSVIGDLFSPAERSRWTGMLQIPSGVTALFAGCSGCQRDSQRTGDYSLYRADGLYGRSNGFSARPDKALQMDVYLRLWHSYRRYVRADWL
jgi:predicted MFS family arabinose efflux permease